MYRDRTVVVVDSDAATRKQALHALEPLSVKCLVGSSLDEALRGGIHGCADLVIVGTFSKTASVHDAVRTIRGHAGTRDSRIIALADEAAKMLGDDGLGADVDQVLAAPWFDAQVRRAVRLVLENAALNRILENNINVDPLTELPTRARLLSQLREGLEGKGQSDLAVLVINLDGFSPINNAAGTHVGDQLLAIISRRISQCIRGRHDMVARTGPDEFSIAVSGIRSASTLRLLGERLLDSIAQPLVIEGIEIRQQASVGIRIERGNDDAENMIREADIAMHSAKDAGGGACVLFSEQHREQLRRRVDLERSLRCAIDQRELGLHFQPIVSLTDGRIGSFEALIRWNHPTHGLISPGEFIPIAEQSGLIVPIGSWVLQEACRMSRDWNRRFGGDRYPITIAVNVSKRQLLMPHFLETVATAFELADIPKNFVKLEITESTIVEDGRAVVPVLEALREAGYLLHMDDFGTGYSSLASLHRFPLNGLKLDKSFIDNLQDSREFAATIHAVVALAHNLQLEVVAEGIETAEQVAELQALECNHGQGYYFAKPLSVADAERWLMGSAPLAQSA